MNNIAKYDRILGMVIGFVIGDAIGTTNEFKSRETVKKNPVTDMVGGGAFNLKPGEWTDDTSQMLATMDSLIENNGYDHDDILHKLYRWYNFGAYSHNGRCFDIGVSTRYILDEYGKGRYDDIDFDRFGGNGALCRVIPIVAKYWVKCPVLYFSARCASLTNGDKLSLEAVNTLAEILYDIVNDNGYKDTFINDFSESIIPSDGYAPNTLTAAIWSFETTDNFRDAVLTCANLGDDADSTAAVCGAIAGAHYGFRDIPPEWIERIVWKDRIIKDTEELCGLNCL